MFCWGLIAATPILEAPRYAKESFLNGEGIVYLTANLRKGPAFAVGGVLNRELRVDLYHETKKMFYTFVQKINANRTSISDAFLLPVGNYRLVKVSVLDDQNVRRSWYLDTSDFPVVRVKQGTVSNLGKWMISQTGKDRLDVEFLATDNAFVLADARVRGGIKTAIDGFSGVILEQSEVYNPVETADFGFRGEVVGEYSYSRNVQLTYELNLFRENKYAGSIKSALDRNFASLSQCYNQTVSASTRPQGKLLLSFVASPAGQSFKSLQVQQSEFRHPALQKCIMDQLQQVRLSVTKNLMGVITMRFLIEDRAASTH